MPEYPVKAQCLESDRAVQEQKIPGSFNIRGILDPDHADDFYITYCCPCGCGRVAPLLIGYQQKPSGDWGPTWKWDGNKETPTLEPSINHIEHWHGYLRGGEWVLA